MPTFIQHIGSPWRPHRDQLDSLIHALKNYTLDPTFERYGDFISPAEEEIVIAIPVHPPDRFDVRRTVHVWGNFFDLSHVFSLYTDDSALIASFTELVRSNKATPAYKLAKQERKEQERWRAQREKEQRQSLQTRRHGR